MENKREAFFFPARFCGSLVGFVRMAGEIVDIGIWCVFLERFWRLSEKHDVLLGKCLCAKCKLDGYNARFLTLERPLSLPPSFFLSFSFQIGW